MKTLDKKQGSKGEEAKDWCFSPKKVAFIFFLLFLFFLPLYEAPKNIFSVLFVFLGGWVAFYRENAAQRFKSKDLVVWAFLLLAISPFVAGWNSPYMDWPSRLSSAVNWALMPLVALILLVVNFSKSHQLWALRIFCVGAVVSVGEAFYSWVGPYPELNSVGHVNQSSLYLAFCLIIAALLLIKRTHTFDLALGLAVILSVFAYQGPARSMVGFGASICVIGSMVVIFCINRKYFKAIVGLFAAGSLIVAWAITQPPRSFGPYEGFKREMDSRLNSGSAIYSQRDLLVNSALEVASNSLFGFGIGSYGAAAHSSQIREAVEARGGDWAVEQKNYFSSSHGHNLFANLLVERGLFGVAAMAFFLSFLMIHFGRTFQAEVSQIGILTIAVICLAGFGQSTLHVEHGQLAFVCIGLCLTCSRLY
jgi:hypothetical protein